MTEPPSTPLSRLAEAAQRYDGQDNEAAKLTRDAARRLDWRRRNGGKACDRCRQAKPVSAFSRDSREKDGLRRYCRDCDALGYQSRRVNADSA